MTSARSNERWVVTVQVNPPDLKDNTADADRLSSALKKELKADSIDISLRLLRKIPFVLRDAGYHVTCVVFKDKNRWILIDVAEAGWKEPYLGLAVDLGTTRVVFRLVDLETGKWLNELSFDNPQIGIGPDILTRIHFTEKGEGLKEIQSLIIDGINRHIHQICGQAGVDPTRIFLVSLAGNTTMTHLFLGLSPHHIIREPYIPVSNRPGILPVEELGINVAEGGWVYVFPNIDRKSVV
jgi:uncharacterized 2Fe-2S/4Fe-4S cluster protein (DUF4445 family)